MVLNQDKYDSSSDEDGDRADITVPSYSDLNVLEEVEEETEFANRVTRMIPKKTAMMKMKKKPHPMMVITKDLLSYCKIFALPYPQDKLAIPKSWILFDSQSTVNIFSNGNLLTNI